MAKYSIGGFEIDENNFELPLIEEEKKSDSVKEDKEELVPLYTDTFY